jgi:16S rRNA (cytosine1402-N4)-methyltransferase
MPAHISVLFQEALDALNIHPTGRYIDGTLGAGGHTRGIIERGGRVLAFDWDPEAISFAQQALQDVGEHVQFINASYGEMAKLAPPAGFNQVDGILLDFGLSSRQLDQPERGFSFRFTAPLDMRFDPRQPETAADIINSWAESALADIFWRYGDEEKSRAIAKAIVQHRPLNTTTELAELVAKVVKKRGRIHPATTIFQALRIAVNHELEAVEQGLDGAIKLLKPGGRLVVISFHSLEDRLVKNLFRDLSRECSCPPEQPVCTCGRKPVLRTITRKPVVPSEEEIETNPRSRSAKMRVAEKSL